MKEVTDSEHTFDKCDAIDTEYQNDLDEKQKKLEEERKKSKA